jgi:YVTN family beta-propeller protein
VRSFSSRRQRCLAIALVAVLVSVVGILGSPVDPSAPHSVALGNVAPVHRGDRLDGLTSPWAPKYSWTRQQLGPPGVYYEGGPVNWVTYDPLDTSFWAALASYQSNATGYAEIVAAGSLGTNTANYPVGIDPFAIAIDTSSGDAFVTNQGSNNVSIVSPSLNATIASTPVGLSPTGIAFDPADGELYVANGGSDNLTILDASNFASVGSIAVGDSPEGVAYDAPTNTLWVVNSAGDDVSVVNLTTDRVELWIVVGEDPCDLAIDNVTNEVYVSNQDSENVSVINATTDQVVASIAVIVGTDLQGVVYDPVNQQLYVAGGWVFLIAINTTTNTVAFDIAFDPSGIAVDPATGAICVSDSINSTFVCLTSFDDWTYSVPGVPVIFHETGLPIGADWNVSAGSVSYYSSEFGVIAGGPTENSTTSNVTFDPCQSQYVCGFGGVPFVIPPTDGYVATPENVTLYSNYSVPQVINVSFARGPTVSSITFVPNGLPAGTGWDVYLQGEAGDSPGGAIGFEAANGTYNYSVSTIPGYALQTPEGVLHLRGSSVSVFVNFTVFAYALNFTEVGLPSGATWFLNFTATPPNTTPLDSGPLTVPYFEVELVNGTYRISVSAANPQYLPPTPFNLTESAGSITPGAAYLIEFTVIAYPVEFIQTGLPVGTDWSIDLGPFMNSSITNEIGIEAPVGFYRYTVPEVPGFLSTPQVGGVEVAGAGLAPVVISFSSTFPWAIRFNETGLPAGTGWAVAIGSNLESANTTSLTLFEPNGTYSYVVFAVTGYSTPRSSEVVVSGSNASVSVTFLPLTYPVVFVEVGLPTGTNWSVTITNASGDAGPPFNETEWSTGSAILLYLANGTYSILVGVPAGYTANVSSASFTVAGASLTGPTVDVSKGSSGGTKPPPQNSSTPPPTGTSSAGSNATLVWGLVGALVVALAVAGILVFLLARRREVPPGKGGA